MKLITNMYEMKLKTAFSTSTFLSCKVHRSFTFTLKTSYFYTVMKLVEALHYREEGPGSYCLLGQWNFSLI